MRLYKLDNSADLKNLISDIEVDRGGVSILHDKSHLHRFMIKNLKTPAANILKQDALSIGADLAVPGGTITCESEYVDAILMGTTKHIKQLSKKELAQPFGLKEVAKGLQQYLQSTSVQTTQIMGIINANDDSFFEGSRFKGDDAIEQIKSQIKQGATVIDVGGVSSRPGSESVPAEDELKRVQPIIDAIFEHNLYKEADFSIDSYAPLVIEYALTHGFTIVNDITGLTDDNVAQLIAKYDATVVIMHMKGEPKTMQTNPNYEDVTSEVMEFFEERISKAEKFGIKKIILDPGIGFGKRLEDNIKLIQDLESFKRFGYPILMAASRKSMIDMITPSPTNERLPGTIAINLKAIQNGASMIRVHDVTEHYQALQVWQSLNQL
jgi:dihydropteroate synthase